MLKTDQKFAMDIVSTPEERLKRLLTDYASVEIDASIPPKWYYHSGLEMVRMANVYREEGQLENAYVLYMKFIVLFLEKTKTHPGWNTLPETNRAVIQQKLREVFPKAEQLKSELSKKFKEEYERFLKDEININMDDMDSYNLGFLQFHSLMSEHICSRDLSPIRKQIYSPSKCRKGEIEVLPCERFHVKGVNYYELAEKNAQELINEEQKAKLKAEKKKAKKERQKQKRKELNESHSVTIDNSETIINKASNKMDNLTLNSDKNFEGLDMKAAFLSKVVKRVKNSMVVSEMPKQKKNVIDINSIINDAIDYEKINNNEEALQLFSEAIHLAPRRFDLILKRSHLYYKLAKFEKSIQDSETVLKYIPNNVDANYRLGEAYYALNKLEDAERVYTKLLSLNSYRGEAEQRLFSIRIQQLEKMGYHPNKAFTALLKSKNKTINEAITILTSLDNAKETVKDLYYSDDDESEEFDEEDDDEDEEDEDEEDNGDEEDNEDEENEGAKGTITVNKNHKLCKDPSNPLKCCSLFVCNFDKDITYQEMYNLFAKFGKIKNMRLVIQPKCYAFINYMESTSAGKAMKALQGCRLLVSTSPLIIKYPTTIINSALKKLKDPGEIKKLVSPPLEVSSKPTVIKQPSVKNCPATKRTRFTPNMKK